MNLAFRFRSNAFFLAVLASLFLGGCANLSLPTRSQGALQVTSGENSPSVVYLNDSHLGQTPFFDERIKTGEYTLRLADPNSGSTIWQTNVTINRRTLTVVNYQPATDAQESSSEILLLQPISDKEATRLSISTLPDHVVVKVNEDVKGFSPLTIEDLEVGEHAITLEGPGYVSKTINAQLTAGHHLIIQAELGRNTQLQLEEPTQVDNLDATGSAIATDSALLQATQSATPTDPNFGAIEGGVTQGYQNPEDISGPAVEILTATVGIDWLRVRETPNGLANNEVARVRVGDFFPLVQDSDNGEWRRIEYAPGQEGWVAINYARELSSKQED